MLARTALAARARWLLAVLGAAVVAVACSAALPDGAQPSVTPGVETPGEQTTEESAGPLPTEEPSEDPMAPMGVVWETHAIASPTENAGVHRVTSIGDELWMLGQESGAAVLRRSDDGLEWRRIELASSPGPNQSYALRAALQRPDGGYIIGGYQSYTCTPPYLCRDFRAVVLLSDDGEQWRLVRPAAWSPGSGRKVTMQGLVWHGDQYIALLTFADADWSAYLYTSPDGESWSRATRLDAHGDLLSGAALYSDGANLVVQGAAHLCPTPTPNTPQGWVLGATWTSHIRLWQGTGPGDLRLLTLDDMPFAPDRVSVDCDEIDGFGFYREPHPTATGDVIGGVITMYDTTHEDQSDVFDGTRTVARLDGGTWRVERIDVGGSRPTDSRLLEIGSGYGFVERIGHPIHSRLETFQFVSHDGADWTVREGASPILGVLRGVTLRGERLVAIGSQSSGISSQSSGGPIVTVWTSEAADPSSIGTCEIGPGAWCVAVDVATMLGDDGLDLSGMDLRGIDLRHARLDGITFDGADMTGALMYRSQASGASFVGTDLTGANLEHAELHDLAGAILVDANAGRSKLIVSGPFGPIDGSSWLYTELSIGHPNADVTEAIEIPLTGADLEWARIEPGSPDHPAPVITDLRGSKVAWSKMLGIDLSRANITGVDFTDVIVTEQTICPAGLTYQVVPQTSTSTREVCR